MPNTGIGLAGGDSGIMGDDEVVAIMLQCDITWEQFFPSGQPRIASVQLAFSRRLSSTEQLRFPSTLTI